MESNSALSQGKPQKSFFQALQPAPAWTGILAFALITVLGIVAGAGKILNLAFPAGALALGLFLYFRYPILYAGFSWWLWFLSPFIRRLSDYRSGFTNPSPMLFAPYLVAAITLIAFFQHFPKTLRRGGLPFVLSAVAVIYGMAIGFINRSPFIVARESLDWLVPVSFGFYLFVNWPDFAKYYQNIRRTFFWAVLLTGIYGVIQYVVAPQWDIAWLIDSDMIKANGYPGLEPGPYTIRVFSTMQSVEPFVAFMAPALILLFSHSGPLVLIASGAGYLSFLLSLGRSGWIGWFAGILTFGSSLKPKHQMRLVLTIFIMSIFVIPLASMESFSDSIGNRLQTLSNPQEDSSASGRSAAFQENIMLALSNFVGDGIGGGTSDNMILGLFFNLGWLGASLYLGGMILLVFRLFKVINESDNLFVGTARAIAMTALVRMPANGAIIGLSGVILWGFLGLALAADKYYQHQDRTKAKPSLL